MWLTAHDLRGAAKAYDAADALSASNVDCGPRLVDAGWPSRA